MYGEVCVGLVQIVRKLIELPLPYILSMDNVVVNHSRPAHQYDHDPVLIQPDKLDTLEEKRVKPGKDDDGGILGNFREQHRCIYEGIHDISGAMRHMPGDHGLFSPRKRLEFHYIIQIVPESLGGRNPAGRYMGLIQQAHLLKVGHDVSDGSRRQGVKVLPCNNPRPYRFTGIHILTDDCI